MSALKSFLLSEKLSKNILLLLLVDIAMVATVFGVSGPFNDKIDTAVYVSQIEGFRSGNIVSHNTNTDMRIFKPFYGVLGSHVSPPLSPYVAILTFNLIFLVGLTLLIYLFLRKLDFSVAFSTIGTVWIVMAYPMFKYGIALGTDISAWFFTVATITAVLYGARRNEIRYIVLGSLLGFLGALTKESGVMGLIFAGVYMLMHIGSWDPKKIGKWLLALCAPVLALYAIFISIISWSGMFTFLDWFSSAHEHYVKDYYKIGYFLSVEASTFNVLLIFALIGLIWSIKNGDVIRRSWLAIYIPLFVASLPVLIWPIFVSRILFPQFIFFVPLGLYGIKRFHESFGERKMLGISFTWYLAALPPLASVCLYLLSGNGSLFDIMKGIL
jgi:hypothetical protein